MDEAYKQPSPVAGAVGGGGEGGGGHSKATVRRKKGASAAGQSHQQQQRQARSASASIAVPARSCELLQAEQQQQPPPPPPPKEQLPPRSPVKAAAKVCVPTLEDALDDVQVRFVLNLPEAELSSADRLFFQLEQAWWFYEDFIADAHKHLPHFKLKEFAKLMFEHCEALRPLSGKYNELFEYFRSWKGTIPTAGCILLNAAMTDVVLVKCWKGNSRGLPKGKINQGEPAIDAAIREVQEETGYDARGGANEKDFLTLYLNGQQTTMFIVVGVDETFPFEPQVRKEISAVEWFPLDALPSRSFGVEPFVPRLRRWMAKTKGVRAPKSATAGTNAEPDQGEKGEGNFARRVSRRGCRGVDEPVATVVSHWRGGIFEWHRLRQEAGQEGQQGRRRRWRKRRWGQGPRAGDRSRRRRRPGLLRAEPARWGRRRRRASREGQGVRPEKPGHVRWRRRRSQRQRQRRW
ncbi:unnamed protein product [Ectocarpus sp. 6 AP-2014]